MSGTNNNQNNSYEWSDPDKRRKLQVEALYRMGQDATERFESRRSIEWKLLAILWTLLVLAIHSIAFSNSLPPIIVTVILVGVLGIVIFALIWICELHKSNKKEREKAIAWKDDYIKALDFEDQTKAALIKRNKKSLKTHYLTIHIGITCFLAVIFTLLCLFKLCGPCLVAAGLISSRYPSSVPAAPWSLCP